MKFKRLLHISILVFFFVTGAEWIRSFFYVDDAWWPTERWNFSIEIDRGAVGVFVSLPMREYEESSPRLKFNSFRRLPEYICGIDKVRAADLSENGSFSIGVAGIMIGKARVGMGYICRWIVVSHFGPHDLLLAYYSALEFSARRGGRVAGAKVCAWNADMTFARVELGVQNVGRLWVRL